MDNVKPWQIVLIVIALLGAAFMGWRFFTSSTIPKTSGYMTADIMTGQLYDIQKGKAKGVPLPAKHPDTGDRTLYPVNEIEDGVWEIPVGFTGYLTEKVRKGSVLKGEQMVIEVLATDPIRFTLK